MMSFVKEKKLEVTHEVHSLDQRLNRSDLNHHRELWGIPWCDDAMWNANLL